MGHNEILDEIKQKADFHQRQVKRFEHDQEQQSFHKGAVMAFSQCEIILDQWKEIGNDIPWNCGCCASSPISCTCR